MAESKSAALPLGDAPNRDAVNRSAAPRRKAQLPARAERLLSSGCDSPRPDRARSGADPLTAPALSLLALIVAALLIVGARGRRAAQEEGALHHGDCGVERARHPRLAHWPPRRGSPGFARDPARVAGRHDSARPRSALRLLPAAAVRVRHGLRRVRARAARSGEHAQHALLPRLHRRDGADLARGRRLRPGLRVRADVARLLGDGAGPARGSGLARRGSALSRHGGVRRGVPDPGAGAARPCGVLGPRSPLRGDARCPPGGLARRRGAGARAAGRGIEGRAGAAACLAAARASRRTEPRLGADVRGDDQGGALRRRSGCCSICAGRCSRCGGACRCWRWARLRRCSAALRANIEPDLKIDAGGEHDRECRSHRDRHRPRAGRAGGRPAGAGGTGARAARCCTRSIMACSRRCCSSARARRSTARAAGCWSGSAGSSTPCRSRPAACWRDASGLAALPPGPGFASEWLLFQSVLAAPRVGGIALQTAVRGRRRADGAGGRAGGGGRRCG